VSNPFLVLCLPLAASFQQHKYGGQCQRQYRKHSRKFSQNRHNQPFGISKVNRLPRPNSLSNSMRPPISAASFTQR
jgi:hypothetical protein